MTSFVDPSMVARNFAPAWFNGDVMAALDGQRVRYVGQARLGAAPAQWRVFGTADAEADVDRE